MNAAIARAWHQRLVTRTAWCVAAVAAAAHGYAAVRALRTEAWVANLDLWYYIGLARDLDVRNAATLADGFYPFGLPLVLRIGLDHGLDALFVARTMSVVGLVLALAGLMLLVRSASDGDGTDGWLVPVAVLIVLCNRPLVEYAWFEGGDLIAAGWQTLGVGVLAIALGRDRRRRAMTVAAGCAIGVAYLFRYTALVSLVAVVPVVLLTKERRRPWSMAGWLMAGFTLTAWPQLLAGTIAYGQPFHNTQAKNIWFGIYGDGDFVTQWSKAPNDIGFLAVVAHDPWRFAGHWWAQMLRLLTSLDLHAWPLPLLALAVAGGALMAARADERARPSTRLVAAVGLATVASIAAAWLHPRFLLVFILLEAYAASRALGSLGRDIARRWPRLASATAIAVLALLSVGALNTARGLAKRQHDGQQVLAARLLRDAGMVSGVEVGTNDPYLHDAFDVRRCTTT